jgi:hypothetical protein
MVIHPFFTPSGIQPSSSAYAGRARNAAFRATSTQALAVSVFHEKAAKLPLACRPRPASFATRFKFNVLADAAETRASRGYCFRFAAARADERGDYRPHPKTFVRSPMRFAAAISRHDLLDLDSV